MPKHLAGDAVGEPLSDRFRPDRALPRPTRPITPNRAPDQLRHPHAVELAHEGVPMVIVQRQLGHAHLGITSVYLHGIDNAEIIDTVHRRAAPVIPAASGLRNP